MALGNHSAAFAKSDCWIANLAVVYSWLEQATIIMESVKSIARNIDFLVSIFSSINKRLKPPNLPEFGLCFQRIV